MEGHWLKPLSVEGEKKSHDFPVLSETGRGFLMCLYSLWLQISWKPINIYFRSAVGLLVTPALPLILKLQKLRELIFY